MGTRSVSTVRLYSASGRVSPFEIKTGTDSGGSYSLTYGLSHSHCHFNGTGTPVRKASINVSSLTDVAQGWWYLNYSANAAAHVSASLNVSGEAQVGEHGHAWLYSNEVHRLYVGSHPCHSGVGIDNSYYGVHTAGVFA